MNMNYNCVVFSRYRGVFYFMKLNVCIYLMKSKCFIAHYTILYILTLQNRVVKLYIYIYFLENTSRVKNNKFFV